LFHIYFSVKDVINIKATVYQVGGDKRLYPIEIKKHLFLSGVTTYLIRVFIRV